MTAQTQVLLAVLANDAFDPLILLDTERRIIAANRAARDLFPEQAVIGSQIENLIDSPDLTDLLDCVDDPVFSECPEAQFQIDTRMFRARCNRTFTQDTLYLSLVMQDITQLLHLNRARRDMVANISHELRTPISAIRLLRDTLSRQKIGRKRRQKVLRKIGRELDTLQRIVEGMHDLAMIESGQAIMRLVATPIRQLVEDAVEHLDEQLEQRKLAVSIDVPEDLYALADPGQIGRVLANLVHNAIKVTPKKGHLGVCAYPGPRDTLTICVDDDGPGIPYEERARVFERFYQLEAARTTTPEDRSMVKRRGSGLGLSIARHIVEAHNGRIWVEDSRLGGARFCFTLPAATPPLPPSPAGQPDDESPADGDE
ncbi:MAG: PAS domain-containing sensor histidine kinase [Anaerolineae bacterium]|nr:PAS domain-containing sensor histidine kinase [Anaerolineae bacterium]